jgi:predicted transposase YbfD/YdcC
LATLRRTEALVYALGLSFFTCIYFFGLPRPSPSESPCLAFGSHTRETLRELKFWNISTEGLPNDWAKSGMSSVVLMERNNIQIKTGKESFETSFYVSNLGNVKENSSQIFEAIRGHWAIEADHFVRDTLFAEDDIQCRNPERIKIIASAINTSVNLLRRTDKNNNLTAFRQEINMNRRLIFKCLTQKI